MFRRGVIGSGISSQLSEVLQHDSGMDCYANAEF